MEKKMTKRDYFETLGGIVMRLEREDKDELLEFIDHQIELIDSKAEKAKERAAKAKSTGDALRLKILDLLTGEYQTIEGIAAQIEDEEVTNAKVVARLSQLVRLGKAEKAQVKDDAGRKVMAYRVIEEAEADSEE